MPVTRNRLSNQRSTASLAAAAVTAAAAAATTTSSNTTTSTTTGASTDNADLETKSQNHNGADNSASPDEQSRQLRDRNSLTKPANSSQQQQNQLDADRDATPELDGLNLSKKSKVTQPTRVLPRRSSSRPQSLLLKDNSSLRLQTSDGGNGGTNNTHQSKKFRSDNANPLGDSGAAVPKPSIRSTNRVPNKSDVSLGAKFDITDGPNRLNDRHRGSSSHATSLLSSPTTLRSSDRIISPIPHVPPVSISLPRNDSTSSSVASSVLNGIQSAKRAGVMSARAPLFEDDLSASSGAVNLSTRNRDLHQRVPTNVLPEKKNFNILIAVTGSVATVKLIELIKKLSSQFPRTFINRANNKTCEATISIRVLMTENSKHFVDRNDIINCLDGVPIDVFDDADEWLLWQKMGDPVLHIELRKWADLCLIAPLDANTMAKIANGICDNLLTCVVRAWDVSKRLIYCPAMNVHMYEHPVTREQLCKLQSFGYLRVDCIEKRLACGDVGLGAMASVDTIVDRVVENLLRPIPRLTSPMKSLLNQPTYPIMSTSETPSTSRSSSAVNLMDRFRPDSQINMHASRVSKNPLTGVRNGISPGTSLLSGPKQNNMTMGRSLPHLANINNNINDLRKVTATQPSARPNLVKSLKNLKAVNSDLSISFNDDILDKDDDDNDEFYADANLDLEEEDSNYDIDPSRLLEQSLITDDDNSFGNEPRRGSLQLNNNSSASNTPNWSDSFQRTDTNFTPLFNTSKFLTMCFVKERNCFNCAICKNDYKNRKSMSRHLREQHVQGNIYKCIPCDVGFKRREKLIKHNRDKHQS